MTTPLYVSLPLPAAELTATLWIWHRTGRKYPVLLLYLLTESVWCFLSVTDYHLVQQVALLPRLIMRAVVAFDVCRRSLGPLVRPHRIAIGVFAAVFCGAATGITYACTRLSPYASVVAFRQYVHLLLACGLWAVVYGTRRRLSIASPTVRAYRIGMAWMFTVLAIGGTFVRGGLGYLVFPYTTKTYIVQSIAGYVALTLVALYLAARVGGWRRVPAVAVRWQRVRLAA